MDKKSIIAICVVGVIIVGLIIALFVGDTTSDVVLTVGKTDYSIGDFESYVKAWQKDGIYTEFSKYVEDHGSELKEGYSEKDYISTMFSDYQIYKKYTQLAKNLGVTLNEDDLPKALSSGDLATLYEDYKITSGEYMRVENEMALANKLFSNPLEYISGDSIVTNYLLSAGVDLNSIYNTYHYRVVQVPVDQVPEPGSGESPLPSGERAKLEKANKSNAKAQAEALLKLTKKYVNTELEEITVDQLKSMISGDALLNEIFAPVLNSQDVTSNNLFGYIGKAVEYTRYSTGLKGVSNGDPDSVSAYYMSEDLGPNSYASYFGGSLYSKYLIPFLTSAKAQDLSDLFEDDTFYGFAYVDNIVNQMTDEDKTKFDSSIVNSYLQSQVDAIIKNKGIVSKIKLEELVPIVAKNEEARKQQALSQSGDSTAEDVVLDATPTLEVVSGE